MITSPRFLISLFLIILGTHLLGIWREWYWQFSWLDIPMHFAGGFWVGAFLIFLWQFYPFFKTDSFLSQLIIIVSLTLLLGLAWEVYELLSDYFLARQGFLPISQVNNFDTLKDLLLDMLGASLVVILNYHYQRLSK